MRAIAAAAAALALAGTTALAGHAAPKARTDLFLCGPASLAARTQAGNSAVFKSGPADISAGETYATQPDCDTGENSNGGYTWSLDRATSHVSRGNGQQHGTEHGSWTVTLDDGTYEAGIFNGRISLDECATATTDGACYASAGNVNSVQKDRGEDAQQNTAHWVGRYTTTVTADGCGDDDGCSYRLQTVLSYRVVGGGA